MHLGQKLRGWIVLQMVFAAPRAVAQQAPITLSIVPVGGSEHEYESIITLEVFLTVNADTCDDGPQSSPGIWLRGGAVTLPCTLPREPGAFGEVVTLGRGTFAGGTIDPDGDGIHGPSTSGVPYFLGNGAIGGFAPSTCSIGAGLSMRSAFIGVGQTRYIGTYFYVSQNCARGSFEAAFQGAQFGPHEHDSTRMREACPQSQAGSGRLVPVEGQSIVIDIRNSEPIPCDDGLYCSTDDRLCNGTCLGFANPCTDSLCNEELDRCVECLVDGDCPPDDNPCTDERCSPEGVCQFVNDNSNHCDDGLFCTAGDVCAAGECISTRPQCGRSTPFCDEELNRCLECLEHEDCDDRNPCTSDFCGAIRFCEHFSLVEGPCDDGLFCTAEDVICDGRCIGRGRRCNDTETPICNEELDRCVACRNDYDCFDNHLCFAGVCIDGQCHVDDVPYCDDGLFCTVEVCFFGRCTAYEKRCADPLLCDEALDRCVECLKNSDCDDGNECTTDRCNSTTGDCDYLHNHKPCDDGSYCTKQDQCSNGVCSGTPRHCPPNQVCDDALKRCVPAR